MTQEVFWSKNKVTKDITYEQKLKDLKTRIDRNNKEGEEQD